MARYAVWFDIPVRDLDRAIAFYSAVLAVEVKREAYPNFTIGLLPHGDDDVAGCLFTADDTKPSMDGILLYFNANGRLEEAVAAAETHGGRVLEPPHPIGSFGFCAVVADSEGNRIALHSERLVA
ncbi:glyoxalase [Verrucomicrobia bacterium SCGC AG-212-E04]|nr:glyoxalase [Verrucomicrobia bacterium SCGC AG-212-E04]